MKRKFCFAILIVSILGLSVACLTPDAQAMNLLQNAGFATPGPYGASTSFTGDMGAGTGDGSAAQNWGVWNNVFGTTTTELLPSTLHAGESMIHVTTTGENSGLVQTFLPYGTGPTHAFGSVWVYVLSGGVDFGIGKGGMTGYTGASEITYTTDKWELLDGPNAYSPANEMIIYSAPGSGADYYAADASVSAVPEPSTFILLGAGTIILAAFKVLGSGKKPQPRLA